VNADCGRPAADRLKLAVTLWSDHRLNYPVMTHLLRLFFMICLMTPSLLQQAEAQRVKHFPCPKNVIILIGDGVGYNHIQATNYYLGVEAQLQEKFPVKLAMATYPAKAGEYDAAKPGSNYMASGYNPSKSWTDTTWIKRDFTESAAAATALSTGFKTYNNSIGMSVDHQPLENLVQWAKSLGKSAGVVTTVEFSHATPAGFVAHQLVRTEYSKIAAEMLLDSRCDVIMGCGDPMYDNDGNLRKGKWNSSKYVVDSAFWRDFTAGSGKEIRFRVGGSEKTVQDVDGDQKPDPWTVVRSRDEFRALQTGKTPKRVLGCANIYQTLQEDRTSRNGETKDSPPFTTPLITTVPTLAEMVGGALNVLGHNRKGFFLMIEGGATDWASHSNRKGRLVEEMISFNEAVARVVDWVEKNSSWDETLVIVTGDHETGLLWGEKPFVPLTDRGKGKLPEMRFFSEEHSNSLIPVFARGAGCELYRNFADEYDSIRGPFIQNAEIPQLIHLLWLK